MGNGRSRHRLVKLGTGINDVDEASIFNALTFPGAIDKLETGMLHVSLDFASGEKGHFGYASTVQSGSNDSPVPEPATILLVGAGLVGLIGLGRKRRITNH